MASTATIHEFERGVMQDCKWEFLIFSGKFKTELSVKEEAEQGCLTFNLIASSFMKHFVGQWQVGCRALLSLSNQKVV